VPGTIAGVGEGLAGDGANEGFAVGSPGPPAPQATHPATVIDMAINAQNIANFDIFAFIVSTSPAIMVNICCWVSAPFYPATAGKNDSHRPGH
jgi:hypothetical protein